MWTLSDYINFLFFSQNDMTTAVLKWEEILMPLLQKYKLNITWGDQDLLNIIFHHNPGFCSLAHNSILRQDDDFWKHFSFFLGPGHLFIMTLSMLSVLQRACMCFPVSGTIAQTTACMAATVIRLRRKVSSFSMETGECTIMTSSQHFGLSTKPSRR